MVKPRFVFQNENTFQTNFKVSLDHFSVSNNTDYEQRSYLDLMRYFEMGRLTSSSVIQLDSFFNLLENSNPSLTSLISQKREILLDYKGRVSSNTVNSVKNYNLDNLKEEFLNAPEFFRIDHHSHLRLEKRVSKAKNYLSGILDLSFSYRIGKNYYTEFVNQEIRAMMDHS